jgi:hypothetical protein
MHNAHLSPLPAALLVAGLIILPAGATRVALAHPAQAARQASCAALGTYHVGPRVLPLSATGRSHGGTPAPGRASAVPAIAWPVWLLRGTLVIASYSGCGGSTTGSFAVHRSVVGPPIYGPQRGAAAVPCAIPCCTVPCYLPPTGVISATGQFVQDPLHPTDPTYVTVSATVTTARLRPQLGIPCSNVTGCPAPLVMTSTATFTDVTGYLQVPAPAGQMVTLSFLPPPVASSDEAPAALVLQGWRGTVSHQPSAISSQLLAAGRRPHV